MPSSARLFAVENQLAKVVKTNGGKTLDEHVKAAEVRIEGVRDVTLAALIEKAETLGRLAADGRSGADPKAFDSIYDLSNAIFGLAGAFGLKGLAEAAFSLCDLADGFRSGEAASWAAIDVHIDGIRLLAGLGDKAEAAGADTVLEGLRRVRARVLPAGG
jgi:hypothetical protein